jgi:PPOX class probable F420-dependent enzyme
VIPEGFRDLLRRPIVAHVATIGPGGEPQNNPVWFDWDGEHLKFSLTKTRQKLRNLEREPRISLSIEDPDNHLRYLEVRGVVDRVEEDPDLEFISAMSKKYIDVYPYPNHRPGDERVVVFVRPEHTSHKSG